MCLYNKDFYRENREKRYIAYFMWQLQGFFKEKSKGEEKEKQQTAGSGFVSLFNSRAKGVRS